MGEIIYEIPKDKRFKNLTGQVFGRLKVLEWSHKKNNKSHYLCRCECGNNIVIQSTSLRNGATVSCGCYRREITSEIHTTHGLTNHPLYKRCEKIIERCYNQNHDSFHNYGGRKRSDPIFVQESWRNDIGLMVREIEAEIGLPPFKKAQIDRKENHLGYESGNIHWVTPEENNRNKRNTHNHAIDPITKKRTPTYNIWRGIIKYYYSEVCDEWRNDKNPDTDNGFKNFLKDMGVKPRKISPIKRHDESKPFCKENCYWA